MKTKLFGALATLSLISGAVATPSPSRTKAWKAEDYRLQKMNPGSSHDMEHAWYSGKADAMKQRKKHKGEVIKADLGSQNWGGAMRIASSGELVTSVAASFTIPTPSVPTNQAAGQYSGAAWIGLGGYGANTSLWQAGATWSIDNSGMTAGYDFSVWYEWPPNALVKIPNFTVFPGHVISVNLNADRPGTGAVVIADKTTGQTTSITTSAPNPIATLNGQSAEWIVEDLTINGAKAPFANFYKVSFTGAAYGNLAGGGGQATGATLIHLADSNNKEIVRPSIPSAAQVDALYVY